MSSILVNEVSKERGGWEEACRRGDISLKVTHVVLGEAEKPCDRRTLILKSNRTRYLTSQHPDCRCQDITPTMGHP